MLTKSQEKAARTKRFHHKTRNGCMTCRERRVKCDENKPACGKCARAGVRCKGYAVVKTWLFKPDERQALQQPSKASLDLETKIETMEIGGIGSASPSGLPVLDGPGLAELRDYYTSSNQFQLAELDTLLHYTFSMWGPSWVWRRLTTAREQQNYSAAFVQCLLREPTLMEAMFSAIVPLIPWKDQSPQQIRAKSLSHFGRSLAMLRTRVAEPELARDSAVFWTIVALLVIEQERGDWEGFRTNLVGLRQVVLLQGGAETIEVDSPRAMMFLQWAENCLAQHDNPHLQVPAIMPKPKEVERMDTKRNVSDLTKSIPVRIQALRTRQLISDVTLSLVSRTACLYDNLTDQKYDPKEQSNVDERAGLARDVDDYLRDPCIRQHDFLIGTALFLLVVSHPFLLVGSHRMTLTEAHLHNTTVKFWVQAAVKISGSGVDQSCLLWVGLIIASLPMTFGVPFSIKWKLLVDHIVRAPVGMTWDQARTIVTGFWKPTYLDDIWPACWHVASMQAGSVRALHEKKTLE